jgi:hypothetical protein
MSAIVTVSTLWGSGELPVGALFVPDPCDPQDLWDKLTGAADDPPDRPWAVPGGPTEDYAGRVFLSMLRAFGAGGRCLPLPPGLVSVGERWRYTVVAYRERTRWRIEEPSTLMLWEGSRSEFQARCEVFGRKFW